MVPILLKNGYESGVLPLWK